MSEATSSCSKVGKRSRPAPRRFQRLTRVNGDQLEDTDSDSSGSDDEGFSYNNPTQNGAKQQSSNHGSVFRQHARNAHSDRVICVAVGAVPPTLEFPKGDEPMCLASITASMDGSVKLWSRTSLTQQQIAANVISQWSVQASQEHDSLSAHVSALQFVALRQASDKQTETADAGDNNSTNTTNTHVAIGFTDASIEIWRVWRNGWQWERSIWSSEHTAISSLAFDSITGTLAASRLDGIVQLWDLTDDRYDEVMLDHNDEMIVSCAFWRHIESTRSQANVERSAADVKASLNDVDGNTVQHRIDDEYLYLITLAEDGAVAIWSTHSCEIVFGMDVSTERYGEALSIQVVHTETHSTSQQQQETQHTQKIIIIFSRFIVVFVCANGPESAWTLDHVLDPCTLSKVEIMDARLKFARAAPPLIRLINASYIPDTTDTKNKSICNIVDVALVLAHKNRIRITSDWLTDDNTDESMQCGSGVDYNMCTVNDSPEQWMACMDVCTWKHMDLAAVIVCCSGHRNGSVRFWTMSEAVTAAARLQQEQMGCVPEKGIGGLCKQLTQRLAVASPDENYPTSAVRSIQ